MSDDFRFFLKNQTSPKILYSYIDVNVYKDFVGYIRYKDIFIKIG